MYPQELPFVLGAEVCGTVEAVDDGVTAPELRDRVALPPPRTSLRAGAVEVLDYPDDPQQFGAKVLELTGGDGVTAVHDGVRRSTFDVSLAILGTVVMFGAASGTVLPFDLQRLNTAGSVFLTRPSRPHFMRTRDEFAWCTGELLTRSPPALSR